MGINGLLVLVGMLMLSSSAFLQVLHSSILSSSVSQWYSAPCVKSAHEHHVLLVQIGGYVKAHIIDGGDEPPLGRTIYQVLLLQS